MRLLHDAMRRIWRSPSAAAEVRRCCGALALEAAAVVTTKPRVAGQQ